MKRMIELKEFLQLQALAMATQQLATDNEKRLDDLEDVYTYSNLAIDSGDFDFIDPASPEDFQPVSLSIGDHVYIDGEQTDLTAEMIAEIFDSNLIVLSCGDYPATYPNVILQRQFIDETSGGVSSTSARFEAFVTLDSTVYHYTMIVTRYDSTSEEGGSIVLACTEAATKPVYCHPVIVNNYTSGKLMYLSFLVFNNDGTAFTKTTFLNYLKSVYGARWLCSGAIKPASGYFSPAAVIVSGSNLYVYGVDSSANVHDTSTNVIDFEELVNDETTAFRDGVNRIN